MEKIVSASSLTVKSKPTKNVLFVPKFLTVENIRDTMTPIEEEIDDVPDKIFAVYKTDYDILQTDKIITKKITNEKTSKLKKLKLKLVREMPRLETPQTMIERKMTIKRIAAINREISDINSDKKMSEYLQKVSPYLEMYKKLGPGIKMVSFHDGKELKNKTIDETRNIAISGFVREAKNFFNIDVIQEVVYNNVCEGCGESLVGVLINDGGNQQCPHCNVEKYVGNIVPIKKDVIKTPISNSDYEDRNNFYKCVLRYVGKQVNKLPDNMGKRLDEYFLSNWGTTTDNIRKMPLNSDGRRGDTDPSFLHKILAECDYSDYYEDTNLIGSIYLGWKLPDISHLITVIMSDYDKTQRVYNQLEKERSSSLGTQFRLFKHLELRGVNCRVGDFKITKGLGSHEFHERTWRAMCEGTRDP